MSQFPSWGSRPIATPYVLPGVVPPVITQKYRNGCPSVLSIVFYQWILGLWCNLVTCSENLTIHDIYLQCVCVYINSNTNHKASVWIVFPEVQVRCQRSLIKDQLQKNAVIFWVTQTCKANHLKNDIVDTPHDSRPYDSYDSYGSCWFYSARLRGKHMRIIWLPPKMEAPHRYTN